MIIKQTRILVTAKESLFFLVGKNLRNQINIRRFPVLAIKQGPSDEPDTVFSRSASEKSESLCLRPDPPKQNLQRSQSMYVIAVIRKV